MKAIPQTGNKLTISFAITLAAGVCAVLGLLPLVHVLSAALLVALLFGYDRAKASYLKVLVWIAIFSVGIFMALHRPEGFSYWNAISVEQLHDNGKPYQQFVNLGKFFGALIIFSWVMRGMAKDDLRRAITVANLAIAFASALSVLLLATWILKLEIFIKLSQTTLIFLAINLLITCFSEETFYRLVVQRPSEKAFANKVFGRIFGVMIAATFFTLTHLSGQPQVLAVMVIAGTLYAITYALTRSVSAAVVTHFSVNALHFIFLSYPI
jgi:membrane protease YdiL (CAAX protease family)